MILVLSTAKNLGTVKVLVMFSELNLFTFMMVGQKFFPSKHSVGMEKASNSCYGNTVQISN